MTRKSKRRGGWLFPWLLLSAFWAIALTGLAVKHVVARPSFDAAVAESCPQLRLPVLPPLERALRQVDPRLDLRLVIWRDAESGREITPYREGEGALKCVQLAARARLLQLGTKVGMVKPEVHVRWGLLALVAAMGALLLLPVAWLAARILGRR